jgi:hypothetical protein
LTCVAVAGTGVGINEAINHNTPGIHRESVSPVFTENIDMAAVNHANGNDGTPLDQLPATFEFSVAKSIFQATTNGIPVSQDQLPDILKDSPGNEILFPIKNPGDQKISVETIVGGAKGGGGPIIPAGETEFSTLWRKILTIPNKGSEIIVPVEGAQVFREKPYQDRNDPSKSYFLTAVIRFNNSDGIPYEIKITANDIRDFNSPDSLAQVLKDAPELPDGPDYFKMEGGKPLPAGTHILTTAIDNAKVTVTVSKMTEGIGPDNFTFISFQGKPYYLP